MSITNPDAIRYTADDQKLLDAVNKPVTLTPTRALQELIREKLRTTDEKTHDGAALLVALDTGLSQEQVLNLAASGKIADVNAMTDEVLVRMRTALESLPGTYILEL